MCHVTQSNPPKHRGLFKEYWHELVSRAWSRAENGRDARSCSSALAFEGRLDAERRVLGVPAPTSSGLSTSLNSTILTMQVDAKARGTTKLFSTIASNDAGQFPPPREHAQS